MDRKAEAALKLKKATTSTPAKATSKTNGSQSKASLTSIGSPEKDVSNELAESQSLQCSDYLVGKVNYIEKKVLEGINKLFFLKDAVRRGKKWSGTSAGSSDDACNLLSAHLLQTMTSRSKIESEFMKKKIHFVSDFKFYGDDTTKHNF